MLTEKPWRPDQVLQLLARLFASFMIGMVLVAWVNSSGWFGSTQARYLTLAISTASFHGMALLLTYLFLREQGLNWRDAFGFSMPGLGKTVLLAVLVGVTVLPIAWSLGQLSAKVMEFIHVQPVVQGPVEMLQKAASPSTKLVIGLLAVVVAPFVEELVFRGLIYPTIRQSGFPNLALWGTSLLFAAIHSNLVIFLPLTFLAVVLTLLYESTGNLLAPVLAHSIFNFVNFFWLVAQEFVT